MKIYLNVEVKLVLKSPILHLSSKLNLCRYELKQEYYKIIYSIQANRLS